MLDPEGNDSLYWARFHRNVLELASDELRRRREAVQLTVSDALSGWARLILPAAAAAAALAGVMLVQPNDSGAETVVVEDSLEGVPSLPDMLEAEFLASVAAVSSVQEGY